MSLQSQRPTQSSRLQWFALSLAILANSIGCQKASYDVEMSASDGQLERKIVVEDHHAPEGENGTERQATTEELLISEAYGSPAERVDDGRLIATGTFESQLPNDVGGAGTVHVYRSSLGTLHVYLERFRGTDDLASQVDEITRTANALVDHAHEWVGRECEDPQMAERFHVYLESKGQQDLRNLGLFVWGSQFTSPKPTEEYLLEDMLCRVMQYALEREYVEFDDVPVLLRLSQHDDKEPALAFARKLLARYLNVTEVDIAQAFPAMNSPSNLERSVREVISREELASLLSAIIRLRLFGNDTLTVRLSLPQQPLWANGKWIDEKKRLEWKGSITPREDAKLGVLPTQCFAVWGEPNIEFQQEHFGRVIVDGEELAEYVLWESSLTDDESQQWKAFTETLTSEDELAERLGEFEFSTDPETPRGQLLDTPRRLLTSIATPAHD